MAAFTKMGTGALAAVAAAIGAAALPATASAQGFIDFLWGGDVEWGGKRQVVSFTTEFKPGQIVVSFGDRRLYLVTKPGQAISYPIAVPREQSRWQGVLPVTDKRENPAWTPTPDMIKENPRLPSWVPGGHPMNPLGVRGLYLGSSTYRIHGTDAPWTIGQAVSKGCIRMFNEDVLDLYPRVPIGTKVTVTWDRFDTSGAVESASASTTPAPGAPAPVGPTKGTGVTKTAANTSDSGTTGSLFDLFSQDSTPPQPAKGLTKFNRKVGGGQVSRAAQTTAQAN
jgi:lipoprotein-anchoring transpeptidase ErfK/SrfK